MSDQSEPAQTMRFRHRDFKNQWVDAVSMDEARAQDIAALQRETGWKMGKVQEMGKLEMVAASMLVFFTWRSRGRLITLRRAEEILDELAEDDVWVNDPADGDDSDGEAAPDPRLAPPDSGRGAADDEQTPAGTTRHP